MNAIIDWRNARVEHVQDLSSDIRLFEIAYRGPFTPATPGSHIDVTVMIADRPAKRSYSTLGPGVDGRYQIAVKRAADSRGGSAYMWSLQAGAHLQMSAPLNHFELNRDCPDYLLVAGGIGVTPILSMARALSEQGAKFKVLYGCRSPADAAFADELKDLAGERLQFFFDSEGQRIDFDGEIARLDGQGELYVCGPLGMLDAARSAWAQAGRAPTHLRFETFGNSGRHPNMAFTLHIANLDRTIEVGKTQTMLEAMEDAGVEAMFDCRRGECGLCALDVVSVEGEIDHRDIFFSDEEKHEGHKVCVCVSRVAGGRISVDTGER